MRNGKSRFGTAGAVFAGLALIVGATVPLMGVAADHLDAPGGVSPGGSAESDINDVYAFEGEDDSNTVLAMTVHPVADADSRFGTDVLYQLKVDTDGDAVEDIAYKLTFSDVRGNGTQFGVLFRAEGEDAQGQTTAGSLVGFGSIEKELPVNDGGTFFAGLRSDPFFFDLAKFRCTVGETPEPCEGFGEGTPSDFFEDLDTLAIVLEVPDSALGGDIGVWATNGVLEGGAFTQADRMGRPAINTAVNSTGTLVGAPAGNKEAFNEAEPVDDAANFTTAVEDALAAYSATDPLDGAYDAEDVAALVAILLPDILTYDTATAAAGPLNGRALADDVIDAELNILTGGLDADGDLDRDAVGGITTDGVVAHTDYLASFPYLGEPHATVDAVDLGDAEAFNALLSGAGEVPDVDTPGGGASSLALDTTSLAHLEVTYDLVDAAQAHIHLGDPDENGPVVVFLFGPDPGTTSDGILAQGSVDEDDLVAGTFEDLVEVLRGEFGYVNVHTVANPGGEIRGQVDALVVTNQFVDDEGNTHEENINIIGAAGITRGCNPPDNDEFCPDDNTTRGQMAAFLNRALGLPFTAEDFFVDDEGNTFEQDINELALQAITRGCNPPDNDEFCPDDDITRGQMAAFVVRAWDLPPTDTDHFTDDDGHLFEDDINRLAEAGITKGCNPPDNDEFCPDREQLRSEMASFLARAFGWGS